MFIMEWISLQVSFDTLGATLCRGMKSPLSTFEMTTLAEGPSKGRLPLSMWYMVAPRE